MLIKIVLSYNELGGERKLEQKFIKTLCKDISTSYPSKGPSYGNWTLYRTIAVGEQQFKRTVTVQ